MGPEKILFIYFFQPFAQYRNPFTFYYAQSYPLPPKTTLIGMLQRVTERYYDDDFWNLQVSIHGGFESKFWNLQQLIGTSKITFRRIGDRPFIHFKTELQIQGSAEHLPLYGSKTKMLSKAYRKGMTRQEELFNGHIYVFIKGNTELLDEIYDAFSKPGTVLRLGRSEDVIFVRGMHWVENSNNIVVEEKKVESTLMLLFPTYIRLRADNGSEIKLRERCLRRFATFAIPIRQYFYIISGKKQKKVKNIYDLMGVEFKNRRRDVYFESVIWTGFNAILEFDAPTKAMFIKINDRTVDLKFWIIDEFGWL